MKLLFRAVNELLEITITKDYELLGKGKLTGGADIPLKALAIKPTDKAMYSQVENKLRALKTDEERKNYVISECRKAGLEFIKVIE